MLEELKSIDTEDNLRKYQCKVIEFTEDFLSLKIKIHHEEITGTTRFLNFSSVYYFEGPVFWTGANFAPAAQDIAIEIWRRVHPELPLERVKQITKIFSVCIVNTQYETVKIAYSGFSINYQ